MSDLQRTRLGSNVGTDILVEHGGSERRFRRLLLRRRGLVVVADNTGHLPGSIFQKPYVEELGPSVAVLGLAVVVDVEVVLAGEDCPISHAIFLQREDLNSSRNGFAA